MLHVLLATALFAAPVTPADSVRPAAKPGTVRPDTTLPTPPAPNIAIPPLPGSIVAAPSAPAAVTATRVVGDTARAESAATSSPAIVQQATARLAVAAAPAAAPADASAVVPKSPALSATRVDARTVVTVKSSVTTAPLHAVPIPAAGVRLPAPTRADSIVVYKRERTLTLFYRGVPIRSYFVALGAKPVGDKVQVGDHRTPEGLFHINAHNPASKYHLALRISYPDDAHRARAAALGVDPGGDIMIHGLSPEYSAAGKEHVQNDWTNGCVALSNQEIEEIWRAVPDGTPVEIKP
jgi:hypothetical protein